MDDLFQWIVFIGSAGTAVVAAGAMLFTMSMFRVGLALMSSFVALAGLFVLLDADLLAAIQVMMNVGGMLVMILFMVMAMMDAGDEMVWDMKRGMKLSGPGAFSMRMPRDSGHDEEPPLAQRSAAPPDDGVYTCPMHPEIRQDHPGRCPKCGMGLLPAGEQQGAHEGMDMTAAEHRRMVIDMAMPTAQLPWAIPVGIATAALLVLLPVRTPWPLATSGPQTDAIVAVGELLLSRYIIAFIGTCA